MLHGVTDPNPCLAVVRMGQAQTQSPTLNSSTHFISAGTAFHPLEAPGEPDKKNSNLSTNIVI